MRLQWSRKYMSKTAEIYRDIFEELKIKKYDPCNNIYRKVILDNGGSIIYFVTIGERMRGIAVPISKIKGLPHIFWKGLSIEVVSLPQYSEPEQHYIKLQQTIETDSYIFEVVIEDIRRNLFQLKVTDYLSALLGCLKRWEDFFKFRKTPILSNSAVQGLFGELLFVKDLIINVENDAITHWVGTNKETHDFYLNSHAVEVKTTIKQAPYLAHINSEYQLDSSEVKGCLFLRFYALRKSQTEGEATLPSLIAEIRKMLKNDVANTNRFNKILNDFGYFDAAEDYYQESFHIRQEQTFIVKDGFPSIVKKMLPNGISNLEYDLSISLCEPFEVKSSIMMDILRG